MNIVYQNLNRNIVFEILRLAYLHYKNKLYITYFLDFTPLQGNDRFYYYITRVSKVFKEAQKHIHADFTKPILLSCLITHSKTTFKKCKFA